MISKIRNMSIYKKLLLSFLLAIVPMYLLSMHINDLGSESVNREISESMASRVHSYVNAFETEMQRIIKLERQYGVDQDIQRLSTVAPSLSVYEIMLAKQRIQDKLLLLKNSNLYVEEAQISIPMINKTLMSTSYSDSAFSAQDATNIQNLYISQLSPFVYYHNRIFLNFIYPDPTYYKMQNAFILQVVISKTEIEKSLVQMTDHKQGGAIIFNQTQGWNVTNIRSDSLKLQLQQYLEQSQNKSAEPKVGKIIVDHEGFLLSYEYSPILDITFAMSMPEDSIMGPLKKYRVWFWMLSILSLMVVIIFSYWINRFIHHPLKKLVSAFRKLEKGDMELSIHHKNDDEFNYLYNQFNSMVTKLKFLIHEVYEYKIRSQHSELKQLQSQINPHFLYNTYFMAHRMAKAHDIDNVIRITKYLGEYFQYITRNSSDEVFMDVEYNHMLAFIEIQMMRFQSRITIYVDDLPEPCKTIKVPRLILQPLIENAFNHGLKSKTHGGVIEIKMFRNENRLAITVGDNGEDLSDHELKRLQQLLESDDTVIEMTGILNVHRRLQLKFGMEYGIQLSRSEMGGLLVTVNLAWEEESI